MTAEQFNCIFEEIIEMCREVHRTKGVAYANGGDRLGNFKRAAERKGCQPETIISIYGDKHRDSIDYVNRMIELNEEIPNTGEPLVSRFVDVINYYVLNYAAIFERGGK